MPHPFAFFLAKARGTQNMNCFNLTLPAARVVRTRKFKKCNAGRRKRDLLGIHPVHMQLWQCIPGAQLKLVSVELYL